MNFKIIAHVQINDTGKWVFVLKSEKGRYAIGTSAGIVFTRSFAESLKIITYMSYGGLIEVEGELVELKINLKSGVL